MNENRLLLPRSSSFVGGGVVVLPDNVDGGVVVFVFVGGDNNNRRFNTAKVDVKDEGDVGGDVGVCGSAWSLLWLW